MKEDQNFHLTKYKWFQVQNFPLLFGRDMLHWNCFEEFEKVTSNRGPHFTPYSKYFTKNILEAVLLSGFAISLLKYKKHILENLWVF